MAASPTKLKVGLVGGGTVGGGIVNILGKAGALQASLGIDVEIATICVRDKTKNRDFVVPAGCTVVDDIEQILGDASIDLVCEVMGGTTLAKDVVTRSIKAGKHVVTANKALIAQDLLEIEGLLKTVRDPLRPRGRACSVRRPALGRRWCLATPPPVSSAPPHPPIHCVEQVNAARDSPVKFGFEAAVCGGIPIIHALQRDFLADEVTQISGIINGCTNFILSNMAMGGLTYSDALKEASALG